MNSMPKSEHTDPRDVAVAALKQAFRETARADQQLPRVSDHVSKLEPDAGRQPSDQQKWLAVARRMSSRGKLVVCGLIALLAACVGTRRRLVVARRSGQTGEAAAAASPDFIAGPGKPGSRATEPVGRSDDRGRSGASRPTPPVVSNSAPIAAAPAPGQEQLLHPGRANVPLWSWTSSSSRLASSSLRQARNKWPGRTRQSQQFKAVQEQMVRQNAAVVEQLKASQEQMARRVDSRRAA